MRLQTPGFLAEALTWSHNYYIACAVETAVAMGVPPTSLIDADKQPSDAWSSADKKLAIAWTVLQKETCGICGNPIWICRSDDSRLGFKPHKSMCYADAEHQKVSEKRQYKKLRPGERLVVRPYMSDDSPLPSRATYLRAEQD